MSLELSTGPYIAKDIWGSVAGAYTLTDMSTSLSSCFSYRLARRIAPVLLISAFGFPGVEADCERVGRSCLTKL